MKMKLINSGEKTKRFKVFIVDDHPIVREGLVQLIQQEADLLVSGQEENSQQAFEKLKLEVPDIMLVDLNLKNQNGLELVKELKSRYPKVPVLVISINDEQFYAERALHAGAMGYIMKSCSEEMILKAIRCVLGGTVYLSEAILAKILQKITAGKSLNQNFISEKLSARELQVFQFIGTGFGTRQIAEKLSRSVKTVQTYREHIKHKLDLKNASQLVQSAIQWQESNC